MHTTLVQADPGLQTAPSAPVRRPMLGRKAFAENGFIMAPHLLTRSQCRLIADHWRRRQWPPALEWYKGSAATDRLFYDVATDPNMLDLLRPFIGNDIVLWGVSIVERSAAQVHPWHADIESSAQHDGFASIWIGLENTCLESALAVMTRSHRFGKTIQQAQNEKGFRRGEASDQTVLDWAREYDHEATMYVEAMSDGDGIVFDGRLWHTTNNQSGAGRMALLLQYAAASVHVPMPDLSTAEWPFRFTGSGVPVLTVSGRGDETVNRIVPAPKPGGMESQTITTTVQPISLPVTLGTSEPFRGVGLFDGPTAVLERMECHYSVLAPGHTPHPPHGHADEELMICLDGEAEVFLSTSPAIEDARTDRLRPGDFAYYPAYQRHTLRNPTDSNIAYLMFKWQSKPWVKDEPLTASAVQAGSARSPSPADVPFRSTVLLEKPTAYLDKLHMHVTELLPGAGYEPHSDEYDVAIVVFEGKVETLGRVVEPFGVIYYAAGEPHGMRNVGDRTARYLVFEFHAAEPRPADFGAIRAAKPAAARTAKPGAAAHPRMPPWQAFNAWFWSARRPRTHIIEYSLWFYRTVRARMNGPQA